MRCDLSDHAERLRGSSPWPESGKSPRGSAILTYRKGMVPEPLTVATVKIVLTSVTATSRVSNGFRQGTRSWSPLSANHPCELKSSRSAASWPVASRSIPTANGSASNCRRSGSSVAFHTTLGDVLEDHLAAFRIACERADLVVMSGGLGPTQDDLTREALALVAGRAAGRRSRSPWRRSPPCSRAAIA